ncbi:dihydrodipicolinate synthase family protein [Paenibacillus sp. J5C_2022]|uniref:dihydrodipicolinate synthase family protein n=1 Tax=Paenibacillus sp. J5C2022 TaxID=2977129 RepID=UPI0021D18DF1|nr:dihydrodipicolinate synthase family protein [Paenibacillus sp. J5C2022]MCU6709834.1 dihydrodipicolinate synthase family protein [Paenibacillus sp. J5C2022]
MEQLKGIFTALLTPMLDNDEIDFESLERHIRHQIDAGIRGFYVGGSTGEGFMLSLEEREQLLEAVIQACGKQVPVIAHAGCIGTNDTVRLAKHAERAGAAAVSAVVPFYYKPSPAEIRRHYEKVMAAASLPMIIYHFPGATGVSLDLGFYEEMALHPQCAGVKFTSLNLYEMEQIRARCGEDFLIYNGHDEVYAGGALLGADGAIGSTMNMMPHLFTEMHVRSKAGDWASLRPLQRAANAIIADMTTYDVIPYEKYMLYLQGVIASPKTREPLKQLDAEETRRIRAFYETNDALMRYAVR